MDNDDKLINKIKETGDITKEDINLDRKNVTDKKEERLYFYTTEGNQTYRQVLNEENIGKKKKEK